jgi:hypothetical protein
VLAEGFIGAKVMAGNNIAERRQRGQKIWGHGAC